MQAQLEARHTKQVPETGTGHWYMRLTAVSWEEWNLRKRRRTRKTGEQESEGEDRKGKIDVMAHQDHLRVC